MSDHVEAQSISFVEAQSISCHGKINISLNSLCQYDVTPSVVSSAGLPKDDSEYTIMLRDHYDVSIVGSILGTSHLGQTVTVKLVDNATTNACWGTILVEDKMAPVIDCRDMLITEVSCLDMDDYLPSITDCSPNPEVVQVGQELTLSDCDDDYIKQIKRTYQAVDHFGNTSDTCSQTIKILRLETDSFVNPADFINDNSLICGSDFPLDSLGHPSPDTTGIPFYKYINPLGNDTLIPLFPSIKDICKARLTYKDFVVGKDGCLTKIMREWTFIDACSDYDDIYVYTQPIWIRDTQAPVLTCSHPITVIGNPIVGQKNAHGWGVGNSNCAFSVNIPPVAGTDNCSGIQRYEVLIDSVLVLTKNGGIVNIPADTFELMYVGFDGCGSSDTCVTELIVLDSAAPVAVCDRHSVVGLTNNGIVEVEAFVFDDGSFDDCGLQKMEVRRMQSDCDTVSTKFGSSVRFCCADVGFERLVEFRVWDFTGRHNSCMVTIEIQDKTGPNVDCPAPISIDCDRPYDLTDLTEFGTASANNQCETVLMELDPVVEFDACNRGTITRTWTSSDINGVAVCEQVITLDEPFDFTFANLDSILLRPKNVDLTGECIFDILPDNLPEGSQRPVLLGGPCDLLGASYEDEVFNFDSNDPSSGGACMKVLRNWTIINWCAVDSLHTPDVDERRLHVAQIIKITNTKGPDVTLGNNQDEICTFDNDCSDGPITLSASAIDDCSGRLRSLIILDAFNDGIINDTLDGVVSYDPSSRRTSSTINGNFPIGTHRILFTFIDDCNNISSRQHIFTIKNCKAPTCALKNGLRVGLQVMDTDGDGEPDNEMACIWASDFDASSVSACGGELTYSFNKENTMPDRCFSCCEIGSNQVDVYVFDQFGNHSFCTTTITIDDHNDVNFCSLTASCPDTDVTVTDCGGSTNPSVLGQPSIGDGCACSNLAIPFNDVTTTTDDGCRLITRTWSVSCDNSYIDDCVQRITVRNTVAPEIVNCPGHITMNLGGSTACEAFISINQPDAIAGCNDDVSITHNSAFADMQGINASGTYPVGTTEIRYRATNGCGLSTSCIVSVTIRDNNDPVCNPRDITVSLRDDGEVTVGPRQLDNGSEDSCGDVFTAGSNMTFDCDDAGTTQPVIYFIEDESGNRVQCSANVTIRPVDGANCNAGNITVSLSNNGTVTVDPTTLHQGSGGICGDVTITGTPVSFDCCDAGTTRTVSYFINGTTECSGNVTIENEAGPVCNSNDITVSLNANGVVNVNPQSLYEGSGGVCFTLGGPTNVQFDCDEAGTTQVVSYTLTDDCDNSVTNCPVNVTINPEGQADCDPQDITVSLGADGTVTVDPVTLHGGGNNGICGDGASITGVPVTYDCCDAGFDRTITYVINGTLNCNATVTIRDEADPVCSSNDITVSLDAAGTVTINPRSLYTGNDGLCFNIGGPTSVQFTCAEAGTTQQVTYTLIDECDDSVTNCPVNVTISEEAQPACNAQDITVTLDDNGSVTVDPTTLQQGGGGTGVCGNSVLDGTPVTYDCCDAGLTRTVTYTINGTITCTASVTINEEAQPVCNSTDITVSLNATGEVTVDPSTLYGGTEGKCFTLSSSDVRFDCDDAGTTQSVSYVLTSTCDNSDVDCPVNVTINPTDDTMISCPDDVTVDCGTDVSDLSDFGTATAADGCGGNAITPTEEVVSNLGVCGMGVITRTFSATGSNGDMVSCVQIITVSGPNNPVTEADITWPTSPFLVTGCGGAAPADGRPVVNTDNAECSNISMSSVDSDLVLNNNTACEGNVVRTWTVIDSCQLDGAGNGRFTFEQVFEFRDDVDPVLTVPADITISASGDECEADVTVNGISATDNCDPNPTVINDSPFADTNNSGNINGTYPVGTHVVNITVTDRCGNETTESITITVTGQSSSFSFECKKKIFNLNDNQMATVHVDSIVCIAQTCDGSYTASFSNTDPNDRVKIFTCADLGPQNGFMSYVYLNGVLVDSCSTLQIVEDRSGFCNTPLQVSEVSGFIRTESGEGLGSTTIELNGSEFPTSNTDETGFYAFPQIPNGGSYTVVPEKDDDHLNGVTTLDLIMIQKHILGLDLLDSPYKLIAADINDSKSVSVADIVQLRKLILGVYDELPENTSWKAIDASFEFENALNPFASNLPEDYEIFDIQSDMDIDFIGVKIGDVNQSAKPVEGRFSEVRSNDDLAFAVSSSEGTNGSRVYEFRSGNYSDIEGFQFTLDLAKADAFVDIKPGALNITDENIGLRYIAKGLVSISYHESEARTAEENELLFSLVLKSDDLRTDPFSISNSITTAEAYGKDIYGVVTEFASEFGTNVTDLYQNNPNPWTGNTQIEFVLPENMEASISVYDIAGRVLYRVQESYKKGSNTITLDKEDLANYNGVAYYELVTKDVKLIKSMILIE